MVRTLNSEERLVEQLFKEVEGKSVCPYVRKDDIGPYCSRGLEPGEEIYAERRMICGTASLHFGVCIHTTMPVAFSFEKKRLTKSFK